MPLLDPTTGRPQEKVQLGPDGKVIKPQEKTFFQKYWMYLFGGALFMAIITSEQPADQKGQAAKK